VGRIMALTKRNSSAVNPARCVGGKVLHYGKEKQLGTKNEIQEVGGDSLEVRVKGKGGIGSKELSELEGAMQ